MKLTSNRPSQMKIINKTGNATIEKAAMIVMKHCQDDEFLKRIREHAKFNFTTLDPKFVAHELYLQSNNTTIFIETYKTFSPFSKVIGYAEDNVIYANSRKFDLDLYDRVQNIYHEYTHLAGFSHKGNKVNAFNLGTVPYAVGRIFAEYVKEIYG